MDVLREMFNARCPEFDALILALRIAPPPSPIGDNDFLGNFCHANFWRMPGKTCPFQVGDFFLIEGKECLAHCYLTAGLAGHSGAANDRVPVPGVAIALPFR